MMHFLHYPLSTIRNPQSVIRNPILILHGRGGSSASWTKVGQGLADAGHEVRIPDLAGHGQTPLPHAYTIDDYTTDILDFIENEIQNSKFKIQNNEKETNSPTPQQVAGQAHQIAKSLIIAHSNGGRIALHLAATHPDLVSQLILINSAGVDLSYDPSRYRTIKRVVFPPIARLCKKITPRKLQGLLYRLLGGQDYLATAHDTSLRETFVTMLHTYIENDMTNIDTQTIPTTLIRGGRDSYTPLRQGKRMHHLIVGSKLIVYPHEKHGIHLHNPALLIKKLKEIITKK